MFLKQFLNKKTYKTNLILLLWAVFLVSFSEKSAYSQKINTDSIENKIETTTNLPKKIDLLNVISFTLLTSNPEKAFNYNKQALDLSLKSNNTEGIAYAYNILGLYYRYKGDYSQSIDYHYKSLELYEKLNDNKGVATVLFGIGNILSLQKNYSSALEYYNKSLLLREKQNDKKGVANIVNSIGIVYKKLGKLDTALIYYKKSLTIQKEIGVKSGIADALNNIAIIYFLKKDTLSTLDYFNQVLKIRKEIGDRNGEATILYNIGFILESKKDFSEAINHFNQSLLLSKELGDSARVLDNYGSLHETYADMKDFKTAYKYFVLYDNLKDYINDESKSKQITEIQTKYETEKKEKEIVLLNKDKTLQHLLLKEKENELEKQTLQYVYSKQQTEIENQKKEEKINLFKKDKLINDIALKNKDAKVKQQRIVILSVVALLFIVVLFSILMLRLYHQKKEANLILAKQKEEISEKNEELNLQKEEISAQRDNLQLLNNELFQQKEELTTQRDEISIQRNIIEKHNRKITSSISYAQRIQKATLPSESHIKSLFPQSFVLFKPKDIVSGDFYWIEKKGEKIYFATADCTGHGVPGAFMSMLSFNLLNDAINDQQITKPSEIISFISKRINKTLRQRTDDSSVKDGLDLALCCFDTSSMKLEYAGVRSTIYIITDNNLNEYKPDLHPIGEPFNNKFSSYTNIEIPITKGDCIYLFTDGYTDQFGGEFVKKLSKKRLKEQLLAMQQLSMSRQKEALESIFDTWKGLNEQIDDMLILGIKI